MPPVPPTERWRLQTRLVVLGGLAALLLTTAGGWVLRRELHETLRRGEAQALQHRLERVAAELQAAGPGRALDAVPAGAEFEPIFSGWYWQLGEGADAPRSRSLWDAALDLGGAQAEPGAVALWRGRGPRGEALLGVQAPLVLRQDAAPRPLHVYGPAEEHDRALARVDRVLLATQVGLVAALLLATALQARLGLAPLRRLQAALAAVREGHQARLGADVGGPDLAPLAGEIDAVLDRNRQIVERARHHAGDLGHALKKPLARLAAEAAAGSVAGTEVRAQVDAMHGLIERHLVRSASGAGQSRWCDVAPVLDSTLTLVRHLHAARALHWQAQVSPALRWQGDAADLEEMAGNLLDNAGKWARSQVRLQVQARREGAALQLSVDDDGPGLDDAQLAAMPRRGLRHDEAVEGSGLGLAIVDELARTYGGQLRLTRSTLGGLRAELSL